jgi:hypothetical protein
MQWAKGADRSWPSFLAHMHAGCMALYCLHVISERWTEGCMKFSPAAATASSAKHGSIDLSDYEGICRHSSRQCRARQVRGSDAHNWTPWKQLHDRPGLIRTAECVRKQLHAVVLGETKDDMAEQSLFVSDMITPLCHLCSCMSKRLLFLCMYDGLLVT